MYLIKPSLCEIGLFVVISSPRYSVVVRRNLYLELAAGCVVSEPPRVFAHCLITYLHTRKGPKPPLDSRLGAVRVRACSELDLLTLFQPVPSLQGDRHDTGFLLNKSGRRALSVQTAKMAR